jgi:hypothetical protein
MTGSLAGGTVEPARVLPIGMAPASLPVFVRVKPFPTFIGTRKREWIPAVLFLLPLIVIGVGAAVFAPSPDDRRTGLAFLIVPVVFVVYAVISVRRQVGDGFSLGADHTGVYLRPNLDRTRVVFVPWSSVEAIFVRRWRGPQLVVQQRDKVIERPFDLEPKGRWEDRLHTEWSQHRRTKKLGTNIHAPVPGVDLTELLNGLRYQAAGRAPVETR